VRVLVVLREAGRRVEIGGLRNRRLIPLDPPVTIAVAPFRFIVRSPDNFALGGSSHVRCGAGRMDDRPDTAR
jgi:hypothetical protein